MKRSSLGEEEIFSKTPSEAPSEKSERAGKGAPQKPPEPPISRKKLLFHWFLVFLCVGTGIFAYSRWRVSFELARPKLAAAHPFVYAPVMEVTALRLWWEEPLKKTPGIPLGERTLSRIRRVKKGDSLAPGVRAPEPGFFLPWQDGLEEEWSFSSLWRNEAAMERTYLLQQKDGFPRARGEGKLVKIPQDLRLLFRLPRSPRVESLLRSGTLNLSFHREGRPVAGVIETERFEGSYVCLLVSFPNFPPEMLLSRVGEVYIFFPEQSGVLIPQRGVAFRNRREGVFLVTGGEVLFRPVEGKPVDAERYLVTKGLKPGELIMADAQIAEEGRLRIW
jgi:hypothetical protein